jgi:hypothetical protein
MDTHKKGAVIIITGPGVTADTLAKELAKCCGGTPDFVVVTKEGDIGDIEDIEMYDMKTIKNLDDLKDLRDSIKQLEMELKRFPDMADRYDEFMEIVEAKEAKDFYDQQRLSLKHNRGPRKIYPYNHYRKNYITKTGRNNRR